MTTPYESAKTKLLDAALNHVAFEGWSEATFRAAIRDAGMDEGLARSVCPRGATDLALAFHARGDRAMVDRIKSTDMTTMRFRDKVAAAVRYRLEAIEDKEAVRRGTTLFSLPHHAADGARAVWGTADLIWDALGDSSDDVNWYTKRATLSAVYSSTLLYWLGDNSPEHEATWAFLDRRIDNVMQIEKLKAQVNGNAMLKPFLAGPNWLLSQIKRPPKMSNLNMPGMPNPPS
jgi:ubiquinone biosynthesis protein COQ9